jgi:hypothetical protein
VRDNPLGTDALVLVGGHRTSLYSTDVEVPTTARADCDRDDQRHILVGRCHGQTGGHGTVRFPSDRHLLLMCEKLRRLVRRYDHGGRRRIIHEQAAGADHIGWQRIISGIAQLCTRVFRRMYSSHRAHS